MREDVIRYRPVLVKHSRLAQLKHRPVVQIDDSRRIFAVEIDKSDAAHTVVRSRRKEHAYAIVKHERGRHLRVRLHPAKLA